MESLRVCGCPDDHPGLYPRSSPDKGGLQAPGTRVARTRGTVKRSISKKGYLGALGALVVLLGAGCFGGGGSLTNLPEKESTMLNLQIRLGKVDAAAPAGSGVFGKAAANVSEEIVLKSMILRFTSNLKDTVRDTVDMQADGGGTGGGSVSGEERSVLVNVSLAPLRWWNLEIKTYDQHDSVIHYGVINSISSKGGQTVNLDVPVLSSRFSLYEARYVLPASIYAAGTTEQNRVYQRIFFNRLVLTVDGEVVRDTTSFSPAITVAGTRFITSDTALKGATAGRFFFRPNGALPDTITHVQTYQYVLTGNRQFEISAYGYLEGDSITATPRLLFQGKATVNIAAGAITQATPVVLDWKGPGSNPTDTTVTPGSPNWTGVGMKVNIGKAGKVTQQINVSGGLNL
jgi:hypothetical protein